MTRLLIFILAVGALAWGLVWLSDNPGHVAFSWQGWHVETTAGVAMGAVAVFAAAVAALYRFWLFITSAPQRVSGVLKDRRRNKGYRALTLGMVAAAAGDGAEASKQAGRAENLLDKPDLALLLKAQAAQLNGDETAAQTFFLAMLENEETEFLGLRGLLGQAMKAGDDERALDLARRAKAMQPKSRWLDDILFDLESRRGRWALADDTLKRLEKSDTINDAARRRRRAVVAYGRSLEAEGQGNAAEAYKWAQKAFNFDPSLVPAAVRLAEQAAADGRNRKARTTVEKTWAKNPHPALLAPYFAGLDAVDGLKRVKAAERLLTLQPDHAESHMALAGAAMDARLWGQARQHLERAIELGLVTRRVYGAMAALADQAGDELSAAGDARPMARATDWLQLAASAPTDPAWVCDQCGAVQAGWTPHCPKCHGLDTQSWRSPPGVQAIAAPKPLPDAHH